MRARTTLGLAVTLGLLSAALVVRATRHRQHPPPPIATQAAPKTPRPAVVVYGRDPRAAPPLRPAQGEPTTVEPEHDPTIEERQLIEYASDSMAALHRPQTSAEHDRELTEVRELS